MYDIAIIGAGPAGANLARLIADKYKVLLIDKRDLDNKNPENRLTKCCGGLLAPDAQKMIAKLGLGVPKDILVDPQLFAVRTIDLTNNQERLYQRFYYNLDREKFDKWMVSIIPERVEKEFNSKFISFSKIPEGYEIKYSKSGQEKYTKTKIIIGADGADSKIRKLIAEDKNMPERYLSIQEWFKCPSSMPYFTAIFDEKISDFYSWVIPKDNFLILGSALKPNDDTLEKYSNLKVKLSNLGFDFSNKYKTEGAYIFRPGKIKNIYLGKDNIALIGEAAGAISPSSAEGISYALKSSQYLALSLDVGIESFLERYKEKALDIRLNLICKNLKSPAMYNPFLRNLIMKSGIQSLK